MSVMLLKQKGYSIETVSNLNEIKLNKIDSSKIDLVIIDLNVIRFSVDYVMRILGSNDMLGKQMFNRDIPV
jgi:DNA-binding response OmpR family regulator